MKTYWTEDVEGDDGLSGGKSGYVYFKSDVEKAVKRVIEATDTGSYSSQEIRDIIRKEFESA